MWVTARMGEAEGSFLCAPIGMEEEGWANSEGGWELDVVRKQAVINGLG